MRNLFRKFLILGNLFNGAFSEPKPLPGPVIKKRRFILRTEADDFHAIKSDWGKVGGYLYYGIDQYEKSKKTHSLK